MLDSTTQDPTVAAAPLPASQPSSWENPEALGAGMKGYMDSKDWKGISEHGGGRKRPWHDAEE